MFPEWSKSPDSSRYIRIPAEEGPTRLSASNHLSKERLLWFKWLKSLLGTLLSAVAVLTMMLRLGFLPKEVPHSLMQPSTHRVACKIFESDCNITAPFVFDSVYGLLDQWSNSYAQNGHSVVKAFISANTLLYNMRWVSTKGSPHKPTFFALDPEMSIGIYGAADTPYLHTMITTKQLCLLYLDGASAVFTDTGPLDTQMVLLKGHATMELNDTDVYDEEFRRRALCDLVEPIGLDGVIRMNAGFEVVICDYDLSGIRQISERNLTYPLQYLRQENKSLPQDPGRAPPHGFGSWFAEQNSFEWIRSATWDYGGERRIKLDLCGMVSFYDPSLRSLSGLHHARLGNDSYLTGWGLRRGHRLAGINKEDVETVRNWLISIAGDNGADSLPCSGTDWQSITRRTTEQHRDRLTDIFHTFTRRNETSEDFIIKRIHELSHAALYQFFEYPSVAHKSVIAVRTATISSCTSLLVAHLDPDILGDFEILISDSIKIVTEKLCSLEWDLFEWSERRTTNQLDPSRAVSIGGLDQEIQDLQEKTKSMLAWIGWDMWSDCERKCDWNELCYAPMWPLVYAPGQRQGGIFNGEKLTEAQEIEFWTPKCISRSDYDRGGGRGINPWEQLPDVGKVPYDNCSNIGADCF